MWWGPTVIMTNKYIYIYILEREDGKYMLSHPTHVHKNALKASSLFSGYLQHTEAISNTRKAKQNLLDV
jgi:hypothetical protein